MRQAMKFCSVVLIGCAAALAATAIHAQAYPNRPIRLILPFPPGGPTDLLGRAVGQKLSDLIGQPVVPENRGGAGGTVGLGLAAKAPADGYTIVLSSPVIAIGPSLYKRLEFDASKDFAPITLVANIQNVMLVHPSVPAKTLKEFIQLARKNPGKLNFATGGVGTTTHLASELLQHMHKIKMNHVPYKGTGLALTALVGGETEMLVMAVPAALPMIQAGKVRPLAVLSKERNAVLPKVPTAKEAGVDDYVVPIWYGILTTAGTPRQLVTRLNQELVKALASPDLKERLMAAGVEPASTTPEEFASYIRSETVRYAQVIKAAGIQPE
jgi:tripartite-type tricarboxylate transporter receptor subunit TctC